MQLGAEERTEAKWRKLLETAGLAINDMDFAYRP